MSLTYIYIYTLTYVYDADLYQLWNDFKTSVIFYIQVKSWDNTAIVSFFSKFQ